MKRSPRFLALLLLVAANAHAEATAAESTAQARTLFQNGLALAQQGDLKAALRAFEAAYAARPHFSVLYNIAQARSALGQPVEAVTAFQRYLADGGKQISETRRAEVQALMAATRDRIGRLRISGGAASARVWLDGAELSAEARSEVISLAKGDHTLVFWTGGAPQSRSVALTGSDVVEIAVPDASPIAAISTTPPLAQLAISCDVPDVDVELVGVGTFKTPQTRPWLVPAGRASLRFSRPGYPTLAQDVLTAEGDLTRVDCEQHPLSPVPPQLASTLNLALTPADANVFVDGKRYRGGPLPAGAHQLSVQRDGFVGVARRISIEAGQTQMLQLSLTQTAQERDRIHRARARSDTAALILGGLALGALGASAGVYAWNSSRYDDWQAKRNGGTATPEDAARIQRGDDAALGLLIAGGALGATSAWIYFDAP